MCGGSPMPPYLTPECNTFNAEGVEFAEETWLLGWSLQWVGCGELHEPHRWCRGLMVFRSLMPPYLAPCPSYPVSRTSSLRQAVRFAGLTAPYGLGAGLGWVGCGELHDPHRWCRGDGVSKLNAAVPRITHLVPFASLPSESFTKRMQGRADAVYMVCRDFLGCRSPCTGPLVQGYRPFVTRTFAVGAYWPML